MRILPGFATMRRFWIVSISLFLLPMPAWAQSDKPPELPALPTPAAAPIKPAVREYQQLLPGLIDALKDEDDEVRQLSALALASIGRDAVPALLQALQDNNKEKRAAAAYAIGRIGPQAREAIPDLVKALKDPETTVKRSSAEALSRLLGPDYNQTNIEATIYPPRSIVAPELPAEMPSKKPTPEPTKSGMPK
jgi:hypothetical protein